MDNKNLGDITKKRFEIYRQWDYGALVHFREVVEETLNEAHAREHQIFGRAGALLSLSGIVLALIVSLGVNVDFQDNAKIFLATGVTLVLISCIFVAWTIIPNYRLVISMESGDDLESDAIGYNSYMKDANSLFALITAERSVITGRTVESITKSSIICGHGICILFAGLLFISISIVDTICGASDIIHLTYALIGIIGILFMELRNMQKLHL